MADEDEAGHRARYRKHQRRVLPLAAVAFAASSPGQSFLIAIFVDDMLADTGLSRTAFSGLYAAGTVVSAICMLALGRVIDRRGLRVAWVAVTMGLAVACGLASVATGALLVFVALALLRTSGQGSFPLLGTLLVAQAFDRRRGQAMAVAQTGITAASVLFPPAVALLILGIGWRQSYQVIGLLLVVLVLPLSLLITRTPPPRRVVADGTGGGVVAEFPPVSRRLGRATVPTRGVATMLFVVAAPPFVATALTFHAVSILSFRGLDLVQAGVAISVLGVASALGLVGAGMVTDRLSNRTLLVAVSAALVAAPLALLIPAAAAAYAAFGFLGLALGSLGVVNGVVWARTYGVAQLGSIQGTAQSAMITAAAAAPLVPAISHGLTGGYTAAILVLAVVSCLALAVALRWRAV
ncbi:MFS transporter [Nocardioides limicola]|uniref:MFS transporter n=1 Tax=Nocardioides limicola TaxID=2803368 RepID=UPI001EF0504E|nr:MFS transporter [Nocardioides sp. DJM-14]